MHPTTSTNMTNGVYSISVAVILGVAYNFAFFPKDTIYKCYIIVNLGYKLWHFDSFESQFVVLLFLCIIYNSLEQVIFWVVVFFLKRHHIPTINGANLSHIFIMFMSNYDTLFIPFLFIPWSLIALWAIRLLIIFFFVYYNLKISSNNSLSNSPIKKVILRIKKKIHCAKY